MIYNISVYASITSIQKIIEADSEEEAKKIASSLEVNRRSEIASSLVAVSSRVSLSDKNWIYDKGSMHLIKRYSSYFPAKCISSGIPWGRHRYSRNFEHVFELFDTHKRIIFSGKNPVRIIRKLCDKGEIGKPDCNDCPAKFKCYTVKKV